MKVVAKNKKKKMLLHCCCAPCAAYVVELLKNDYDLSLFFYNPNIHPQVEYKKRLEELERFSRKKKIELFIGNYELGRWFERIEGYEHEPEKGKRCGICFEERLRRTAMLAKDKGFDVWSTTLTISPHKNEKVINEIGKKLQEEYGAEFLEADFKKNDGFKKSLELSREHGFYRQSYCGCVYSQLKQRK